MKVQVKAYNMPVDEIQYFLDKGYDLCKVRTPDNYDYSPKYLHYIDLKMSKKLVITGAAYNRAIKALKEGANHDIK